MLLALLLLAGMGTSVYAADTAGWQLESRSLARVWDVHTGKPLSEPLPCASAKLGVIFSPDGRTQLIKNNGGFYLLKVTKK